MDFFIKGDGARKEEKEAKRFIQRHRHVIDGLASQLTGGALPSAPLAPGRRAASDEASPAAASSAATVVRVFTGAPPPQTARPYVRIRPDGRVVVMDLSTARQLLLVGVVRGGGRLRRFELATATNGFYVPLDEALREDLVDLDWTVVPDEASETRLCEAIAVGLGFSVPEEQAG